MSRSAEESVGWAGKRSGGKELVGIVGRRRRPKRTQGSRNYGGFLQPDRRAMWRSSPKRGWTRPKSGMASRAILVNFHFQF